MPSFDIVSDVNRQEVKNAIEQANELVKPVFRKGWEISLG